MTTYEDIARQKLSLVVDNSQHRQLPLPAPWYERWFYLVCLTLAAIVGGYALPW